MKCKCEIHFVFSCNCGLHAGTQRNLYTHIKSCCDEFIHATLIDFITFKMEMFLANDCKINSMCKYVETKGDRNDHYHTSPAIDLNGNCIRDEIVSNEPCFPFSSSVSHWECRTQIGLIRSPSSVHHDSFNRIAFAKCIAHHSIIKFLLIKFDVNSHR